VANNHLRGQSDLEKAQVIQWLGFADSEILPASCAWVFPCLGIMQYNKQVCSVDMKSCSGDPHYWLSCCFVTLIHCLIWNQENLVLFNCLWAWSKCFCMDPYKLNFLLLEHWRGTEISVEQWIWTLNWRKQMEEMLSWGDGAEAIEIEW